MKRTVFFAAFILVLTVTGLEAQRINIESGDFDFLTGQTELKVSYDYSNVSVGKYNNEEDYIADRVAELNEDEAGSGDAWREAWLNDRTERFEPRFEELFNDNIEAKEIRCSQDAPDASYEMAVHTTFVEPGYNVGISRRSASINVEITFTEIATGNEMAVLSVTNCQGIGAMGFDFDTGYRIQEAYAMLGRSVARYLLKRF